MPMPPKRTYLRPKHDTTVWTMLARPNKVQAVLMLEVGPKLWASCQHIWPVLSRHLYSTPLGRLLMTLSPFLFYRDYVLF